MPEREPPPTNLPITDIQAQLAASHEIGLDPVLGAKHAFALPEQAGALEVYPSAGIIRVETPTACVQVAAFPRIDPTTGRGIRFDLSDRHAQTSLTLHPDGTVVFVRVPEPTEGPSKPAPPPHRTTVPGPDPTPADQPRAPVPADTTTPPPGETVGSAPAADPARGATEPAHTGRADGTTLRPADIPHAKEPAPRVQLTGRLGRSPTFRTSPRGTRIGTFSLAVHGDDGATSWHSIVAFGPRAEQLHHRVEQGELTKGQEVNVVGYPHTREQPTKTGSRTVTEIHAVAVLTRR